MSTQYYKLLRYSYLFWILFSCKLQIRELFFQPFFIDSILLTASSSVCLPLFNVYSLFMEAGGGQRILKAISEEKIDLGDNHIIKKYENNAHGGRCYRNFFLWDVVCPLSVRETSPVWRWHNVKNLIQQYFFFCSTINSTWWNLITPDHHMFLERREKTRQTLCQSQLKQNQRR